MTTTAPRMGGEINKGDWKGVNDSKCKRKKQENADSYPKDIEEFWKGGNDQKRSKSGNIG